MADISKITLPSGSEYNIKDAVAREVLSGAIKIKGTTTTELTDESTTNPIQIDGNNYTASANDAVFYNKKEYVFDGTKWHEFGDMSGLGALATKNSASASYTPSGTVSQPTFTGTQGNVSVSGTTTGSVAISVGSGTANYTPRGTVSQPTFTGNATTSSGTYRPSGVITVTTPGNGNYTPAGTVSTPTIKVKTAGSTTNVYSITDVGTLPTLTTTVENENLTISFSQGTLPTKGSAQSVKTGDAAYESLQPTFTGTNVQLSFSGTSTNINVSGTPTGTVSQPTFSGTGAELKATFTGQSMTSTGTFTPEGTVSKPTFSGNTTTITVT